MKRKYSAIIDDIIKKLIFAVENFDLALAKNLIQEHHIGLDNSNIYYIHGQHFLAYCLNMLRPDMFVMLLKYSVDIESYKDGRGNNLLHLTLMTHMPDIKSNDDYREIYKHLLKYIDPQIKNNYGQSSLDIAKIYNLNLVEILRTEAWQTQYNNNIKVTEKFIEHNNSAKIPIHLTKHINCAIKDLSQISQYKHSNQLKTPSAAEERLLAYLKNLNSTSKRLAKNFKPLVENAEDINKQDTMTGDTALHRAVENDYHTGIKILLSKTDIDISVRNFLGQTAVDIAISKQNGAGNKGEKASATRMINLLKEKEIGVTNFDVKLLNKTKEIVPIDVDELETKTQISIPYKLPTYSKNGEVLNVNKDEIVATGELAEASLL